MRMKAWSPGVIDAGRVPAATTEPLASAVNVPRSVGVECTTSCTIALAANPEADTRYRPPAVRLLPNCPTPLIAVWTTACPRVYGPAGQGYGVLLMSTGAGSGTPMYFVISPELNSAW